MRNRTSSFCKGLPPTRLTAGAFQANHFISQPVAVPPDLHSLGIPDQVVTEIRMRDGYEGFGPLPGIFSFQIDLAELGYHPLHTGAAGSHDTARGKGGHDTGLASPSLPYVEERQMKLFPPFDR